MKLPKFRVWLDFVGLPPDLWRLRNVARAVSSFGTFLGMATPPKTGDLSTWSIIIATMDLALIPHRVSLVVGGVARDVQIIPRRWIEGLVYSAADLPVQPRRYFKPVPSPPADPSRLVHIEAVRTENPPLSISLSVLRALLKNHPADSLPPDLAQALSTMDVATPGLQPSSTPCDSTLHHTTPMTTSQQSPLPTPQQRPQQILFQLPTPTTTLQNNLDPHSTPAAPHSTPTPLDQCAPLPASQPSPTNILSAGATSPPILNQPNQPSSQQQNVDPTTSLFPALRQPTETKTLNAPPRKTRSRTHIKHPFVPRRSTRLSMKRQAKQQPTTQPDSHVLQLNPPDYYEDRLTPSQRRELAKKCGVHHYETDPDPLPPIPTGEASSSAHLHPPSDLDLSIHKPAQPELQTPHDQTQPTSLHCQALPVTTQHQLSPQAPLPDGSQSNIHQPTSVNHHDPTPLGQHHAPTQPQAITPPVPPLPELFHSNSEALDFEPDTSDFFDSGSAPDS